MPIQVAAADDPLAALLLQMTEDFQVVGSAVADMHVLHAGRGNSDRVDDASPDLRLARTTGPLPAILLLGSRHPVKQFLPGQPQHFAAVRVDHQRVVEHEPVRHSLPAAGQALDLASITVADRGRVVDDQHPTAGGGTRLFPVRPRQSVERDRRGIEEPITGLQLGPFGHLPRRRAGGMVRHAGRDPHRPLRATFVAQITGTEVGHGPRLRSLKETHDDTPP